MSATTGSAEPLADKLQRLCCAETEGKFFDCVTENIDEIVRALRLAAKPAEDVREVRTSDGFVVLTDNSGRIRSIVSGPALSTPGQP